MKAPTMIGTLDATCVMTCMQLEGKCMVGSICFSSIHIRACTAGRLDNIFDHNMAKDLYDIICDTMYEVNICEMTVYYHKGMQASANVNPLANLTLILILLQNLQCYL